MISTVLLDANCQPSGANALLLLAARTEWGLSRTQSRKVNYLPFGKVSAASQNADGSLGSDWLADVFIDAHLAMKL